jgi:hypothetical protein
LGCRPKKKKKMGKIKKREKHKTKMFIKIKCGLDDEGFESWQGLGIVLFSPVSRPVWGSPSLLPSRYEGLYPWG